MLFVVFSSRKRHTGGALVAGVQTCARPISNGRALELWSITPGQAPRSLGLVLPGQTTVLAPSLLPQQGDTVAITLEPAGGAPGGIPTGPVVLSGKKSAERCVGHTRVSECRVRWSTRNKNHK